MRTATCSVILLVSLTASVFTGDKAPYFNDTAHFTCQGQAMVARSVADGLLATGSVR